MKTRNVILASGLIGLLGFFGVMFSPPRPAQASSATLSQASLTFPSETVGMTSPAQTVTLTNSGATPLLISGASVNGDFLPSFGAGCSNSIAAGTSCTINITFTPTASGTRTGALTINDDAAGSPQVIALTGTGAGGAPTPTPTSTATSTGAGGGNASGASLSFTANPATLSPSQTARLTWTTTNVASCNIFGGGLSGYMPAQGQMFVSPQTTQTYTMTCKGSNGGSISQSVTVTVGTAGTTGNTGGTSTSTATSTTGSTGGTSTSTATSTTGSTGGTTGSGTGGTTTSTATSTTGSTGGTSTSTATSTAGSAGNGGTGVATTTAVQVYNGSGPVASWKAYLYLDTDGIYHQAIEIYNSNGAYPVIGYSYFTSNCSDVGDTFNDFWQPIGNGIWWFTHQPGLKYVRWVWYNNSTQKQVLQQTPCIDYNYAPKYN